MIDKSFENNLELENELFRKGHKLVAGVDEVGRGCFAGPVVAAAVIMEPGIKIPYLTDSKKIPKKYHADILEEIMKNVICWNISVVDAPTIDNINIRQATLLAMKDAVNGLEVRPDYVLVDGSDIITDLSIKQSNVIQGDYYSHTISAASLLAKGYRDKLMSELDERFGNLYEWANNAGYPTPKHIELVNKHGLTAYHRRSWKTMEKIINK